MDALETDLIRDLGTLLIDEGCKGWGGGRFACRTGIPEVEAPLSGRFEVVIFSLEEYIIHDESVTELRCALRKIKVERMRTGEDGSVVGVEIVGEAGRRWYRWYRRRWDGWVQAGDSLGIRCIRRLRTARIVASTEHNMTKHPVRVTHFVYVTRLSCQIPLRPHPSQIQSLPSKSLLSNSSVFSCFIPKLCSR